jgi:hypothetical protein
MEVIMRFKILKMFMVIFAMGLLAIFVLSCNGSSGGGGNGDDDNQSLSITGESGNQVNLDGNWDTGCQESDDEDLAATRWVTSISGSNFSQTENQWYDSITCIGVSDLTLAISGNFVLGDEVTADLDGADVTATEVDLNTTSVEATINNPDLVADFNADQVCGFDDWVVDTSKEILGSQCNIDIADKDLLYIDDTVDPNLLYSGDVEGPVDANGYPTELVPDDISERS